MALSRYVEDIFEDFYKLTIQGIIPLQYQDSDACYSFYNAITEGGLLTENQQKYIVRILDKYKMFSANNGLDYQALISAPSWKNPVRVIDRSKKVWVEEVDGHLKLQFKFPFQLKEEFEKEIEPKKEVFSSWDHERKIRSMMLYNANLISVNEFVTRHRFEIDESFLSALAQWEEILDQQENVAVHCEIKNGLVSLINAAASAQQYWQEHCTGNLSQDLMLAKSMGYLLINPKDTAIETIASQNSLFWVKSFEQLFELYKAVDCKMCIVLDRAHDSAEWLKQFVDVADKVLVNRSDIKVCFRENKSGNIKFNDWVKNNGLGGAVEQGKILIFQHKPAKWLFKQPHSVKMLVTNNIYPPSNTLTREWLEHHHCSIFLGDIKPSKTRNIKIVQL